MIDSNQFQVFIATYKRPEMLARQLDSLLGQTFRPQEITVLDNASDVVTRQIVESRVPRGARYVDTSALGSLGNMKFAIAHTHETGYVAVFHDDDCVAPTYFESVAKVISAATPGKYSIVVGAYRECEPSGIYLPSEPPHTRGLVLDGAEWALHAYAGMSGKYPFAFYRGDRFKTVDIDRLYADYGRACDNAVLLQTVGKNGCAAWMSYPFCVYVRHSGQDSVNSETLPDIRVFARLDALYARFMGHSLRTLPGFVYTFLCRRKLSSAYKRRGKRTISYSQFLSFARQLGALPAVHHLFHGVSNHLTQALVRSFAIRTLACREVELADGSSVICRPQVLSLWRGKLIRRGILSRSEA